MAAQTSADQIEIIGETAGVVWSYLNDNGAVSLSKLIREMDVPRDLAMQGVGWLAREGNVVFEEGKHIKRIALAPR